MYLYRRSSPELDALKVEVVTGVDVTDDDAIKNKMIPALKGKPVDILINNAGYFWEQHETLVGIILYQHQLKTSINIIHYHKTYFLCKANLTRQYLYQDNLNMKEDAKQIAICALGPLHVSATMVKAGLIKGKIVIISSQAGSAEWRTTQNKDKVFNTTVGLFCDYCRSLLGH